MVLVSGLPMMGVENYFRPGTVWYLEEMGYDTPTATVSYYYTTYSVKDEVEVDGEKVLPFYYGDNLKYYLKTDGGKVYWRFPEPEFPEWYLMYDFGLKVGETAEVTFAHWARPEQSPHKQTVRCIQTDITYPDRDGVWMELEYFYTDEYVKEEWWEGGHWLMGIGGQGGDPTYNVFGLAGSRAIYIGASLYKVTSNGVIVYETPAAGMKDAADNETVIKTEGQNLVISNVRAGVQVEVFDTTGKKIRSMVTGVDATRVHLDAPGIYIVRVGSKVVKTMVD